MTVIDTVFWCSFVLLFLGGVGFLVASNQPSAVIGGDRPAWVWASAAVTVAGAVGLLCSLPFVGR